MNRDKKDNSSKATILVVDDNPNNLRILGKMLVEAGYKTRVASNGERALISIKADPPDLILLDIHMPVMDGYEVCRRLRKDKNFANIPIIFISAMSETFNKVLAFEAGGNDYITKPFEVEEVEIRIKTHLKIKRAYEKMEKHNRLLIEHAKLREDIERITQHDLKTPLNAIINYPNLIRDFGNLVPKQLEFLQNIEMMGHKMLDMINRSTDLYKIEQGTYEFRPEAVNLYGVILKVIKEVSPSIEAKKMKISLTMNEKDIAPDDTFIIKGEEFLCYSLLYNLLLNAVEASPDNKEIWVKFNNLKIPWVSIHNQGVVPEEVRDRFFDKYITSGKIHGTGLGTYIAKHIVHIHGGEISMDTSEEGGTTVTIHFPKQKSQYNNIEN